MRAPVWLTEDMIRAIHAESLASFGGASGLRDAGLLESALQRPRNLQAYGADASIYELAATYCSGLIRNHPFVDGNKRIGLLAAAVFLDVNGYDFRPDEAEVVHVIWSLAAGELDDAALSAWFEANATKRKRTL
jgi:death on curing protein